MKTKILMATVANGVEMMENFSDIFINHVDAEILHQVDFYESLSDLPEGKVIATEVYPDMFKTIQDEYGVA